MREKRKKRKKEKRNPLRTKGRVYVEKPGAAVWGGRRGVGWGKGVGGEV